MIAYLTKVFFLIIYLNVLFLMIYYKYNTLEEGETLTVEAIKNKKKIEALLTYLRGKNERDWLLGKFQLNTGLRISDVAGVQVGGCVVMGQKFPLHKL